MQESVAGQSGERMRPKPLLVLLEPNEFRRSILRCVLQTRGYRVACPELPWRGRAADCRLILAAHGVPVRRTAVPLVRMGPLAQNDIAVAYISPLAPMRELLDVIRPHIVRKPGPKPRPGKKAAA